MLNQTPPVAATDRQQLEAERRSLLQRFMSLTHVSDFGTWGDDQSARLKALDLILDGSK